MSALHDMELADTLQAVRLRREHLTPVPLRAVPAPTSPDMQTYQRVRAACCEIAPLSPDELDEHAALIVLQILKATRRYTTAAPGSVLDGQSARGSRQE